MKVIKLNESVATSKPVEKPIVEETELTEEVGYKFAPIEQVIGKSPVPEKFMRMVVERADEEDWIPNKKLNAKVWNSLDEDDKQNILDYAKALWDDLEKNMPTMREDIPIQLSLVPEFAIDRIGKTSKIPMGYEFNKNEDFSIEKLPTATNITNVLEDYFTTNINAYWAKNLKFVRDKDDEKKLAGAGHLVNFNGKKYKYVGPKSYQHANVVFVGPPGAGKSAMITQWLKDNGIRSVTMTGSNLNRYIVNGLPSAQIQKGMKKTENEDGSSSIEITDMKQQDYLRSTVFDALQNPEGYPTVLFIDELNRTDPAATASLLSLLQDKKVYDPNTGGMSTSRGLSTFLFTIAAMNDNDMTDALSNAMADRFNFIYAKSSASETLDYWDKQVSSDYDSSNSELEFANSKGYSEKNIAAYENDVKDATLRKAIIEALRDSDFEFIDYPSLNDSTAAVEFTTTDDNGKVKTTAKAIADLTPEDLTRLGITAEFDANDHKLPQRLLSARGFGTALMRTKASAGLGNVNAAVNESGTFLGEIRKWCTKGQYLALCKALKPLASYLANKYKDGAKVNNGDTFKDAWENARAALTNVEKVASYAN